MPWRPPTGRGLEGRRDRDRARPNVAIRRLYRTERWARLRARILRDAAYHCAGAGCVYVGLALDVDHVRPHGNDPRRFWDPANLQALCKRCHRSKTMRGE